ncbi:MAG: glycosyltransferase family 2 protein [Deltaproteobacteria bacterium]|nr:glycosyltransferase family 2 protein [Deltaproteobacteria bacterium]MBW2353698.1 glycosyltransferase family 2 protein [Deltaproteobacteria bacterium]
MPVSVAIVAQDEEKRIPHCLSTLAFAQEVLVVDSGSRDRTVEIARSHGCRVISEPWRGYARQKQFAVDNCENRWVLILDADEQVPVETGRSIRRITDSPDPRFSAYSLLRKNFFHDRWIRHCGWWPERVVRLVDRRRGRFNDRLVHEQWIADGEVGELDMAIEHRSFQSYSDLIKKMDTYSTLAALDMLRRGRRSGWWSPISHGTWMFFRTYLLELGVMEGFDGFMISVLNGGGSFLKYAKLREMLLFPSTPEDQ